MHSPASVRVSTTIRAGRYSLLVIVIAVGLLIGFLMGNWLRLPVDRRAQLVSRDMTVVEEGSPPTSADIHLDTIDLGVVEAGGRRHAVVWLRNSTNQPVFIRRLNTTCDCVQAHVVEDAIGAQSKSPVLINFDGSREPDFTGKLGVKISSLTDDGREVQVGRVEVELTSDWRLQELLDGPFAAMVNGDHATSTVTSLTTESDP